MDFLQKTPIKQFLESKYATGTALLVALTDVWGIEFVGWDPDTIEQELEDDLNVSMTQICKDRLHAACAVLSSNVWKQDVHAYFNIVQALAGNGVSFKIFDLPTVADVCQAQAEAFLLDPPDDPDRVEKLSPDVAEAIWALLRSEGFAGAPKLLRQVMPDIETLSEQKINDRLSAGGMEPHELSAFYQNQEALRAACSDAIKSHLQHILIQVEALDLQSAAPNFREKLRKQIKYSFS